MPEGIPSSPADFGALSPEDIANAISDAGAEGMGNTGSDDTGGATGGGPSSGGTEDAGE